MGIYRRDEINPEWEPVPWSASGRAADKQEAGFHARATTAIQWKAIPYSTFPDEGLFGQSSEWLIVRDAAFYATVEGEELILIDNTWFGWPDPPRWGLVSRSTKPAKSPWWRPERSRWSHWGHFAELPPQWTVPTGP